MGVLTVFLQQQNLMHQIKQLPEGAFWQVIGISRKQWYAGSGLYNNGNSMD